MHHPGRQITGRRHEQVVDLARVFAPDVGERGLREFRGKAAIQRTH